MPTAIEGGARAAVTALDFTSATAFLQSAIHTRHSVARSLSAQQMASPARVPANTASGADSG